jgi:hypothetical protein
MVLTYSNQTKWLIGCTVIWLALFATLLAYSARSQTARERAEIAAVLAIEKISVKDGVVSGEIYNRSSHTIRDVQLFIRYTWLWDAEFKPGKDDPGTSIYYTLPKELPAGGRLPFTYSPSPPLPKTSGGRFETTVTITGYAEVIPQTKQ